MVTKLPKPSPAEAIIASQHGASKRMPQAWSRRLLLGSLTGSAIVSFASVVSAQNQENDAPAYPSPSDGAAEPSAADLTCGSVEDDSLRLTFQYVDMSVYGAAQDCRNCEFWIPVEAGQSCGGCTLIAGPISPYGWCTAWAPVPAAAGAEQGPTGAEQPAPAGSGGGGNDPSQR
jgi:hypothetical protein